MAEQEINVALESSVEDVKSSIGATGNTGGSTTTGTVFGKLNKIIADLASHISSWTSTRAGYIDTIKSNTDRLTSARATKIDNIGATGDTGGSVSAGTVMGKLNALLTSWTSTRAGYVDRLANGTYGLDKIKADTGSILSKLNSGVTTTSGKYIIPSDNVLFTVLNTEKMNVSVNSGTPTWSDIKLVIGFDGFIKIKFNVKVNNSNYNGSMTTYHYFQYSTNDNSKYTSTQQIFYNTSYTTYTQEYLVKKGDLLTFHMEYPRGSSNLISYCNSITLCGTAISDSINATII